MNRHADCPAKPQARRTVRRFRGFTLIEVMITVAIIGILTAIALPSYRDYVLRGYLVDGTNLLTSYQAQMERYYQDNRTYMSTGTGSSATTAPCAVTSPAAPKQGNFTLSCATPPLTAQTYRLTATGSGPAAGFVYTLDNLGVQTTAITNVPGWSATSNNCWIVKKGMTTC